MKKTYNTMLEKVQKDKKLWRGYIQWWKDCWAYGLYYASVHHKALKDFDTNEEEFMLFLEVRREAEERVKKAMG